MTRVYATKGDQAKRYKVTVPMSGASLDRLRSYAAQLGRQPTAVARDLIETGIEAEAANLANGRKTA
jgi:hypothetical protein